MTTTSSTKAFPSRKRRRPFRRARRIDYTLHDETRQFEADQLPRAEERTEFERDRSRIIHSAAFRRLQGKTQVFMAGEGDFLRTRLTHSLEVAQIGKGIALRLGADSDLVEAISLLHDIGHPPFGHAGEDELKTLMKRYGGFEANAQNIRIINKLERKSEDYDGLNLTRAVIDGQMKYKQLFDGCKRKFIYKDDVKLMHWAQDEAKGAVQGGEVNSKSFECQIMDWADDVAYAVHDLEDSIHTGYIDATIFHHYDARTDQAIDEVVCKYNNPRINVPDIYSNLIAEIRSRFFDFEKTRLGGEHPKQKASRKRLTSFLINRYIKGTERCENGRLIDDPVSFRYFYNLEVPTVLEIEIALINKLIWKHVIESPQIRTLEAKGKHIVRCLFLKFMRGSNADLLLPHDWQEYLSESSHRDQTALRARVVSDYISGMTDEFAQRLYSRLYLPNHGSIYERL